MEWNPLHLEQLLSLIESNGGQIDSRIRIQKLVYILKYFKDDLFETASFRYHHFGPYSREVSDLLNIAVSAGMLTEITENLRFSQTRYSYKITDSGLHSIGSSLGETISDDLKFLSKYKNVKALELAATILYLEEESGAPRMDALDAALQLKPACLKFEEQAKEILHHFDASAVWF